MNGMQAPAAQRSARLRPVEFGPAVAAALRSAERAPSRLRDAEAMVLFEADGAELDALCAFADDLRREVVGEAVTYVVTRAGTASLVYGADHPLHWLQQLRKLARIQDETGVFTRFEALPFARTTERESRVVHAMARLLLDGRIDDIDVAWTELGVRRSQQLLCGGANGLGPVASDLRLRQITSIAAGVGRPAVRRQHPGTH